MRWLFLVAAFACSKTEKPAGPPPIVADATGVFTFRPTDFTILQMLDQLPTMQKCWRQLEEKLEVTYQVFVGHSSYFIVDGDLPRTDVESCIEKIFAATPFFEGTLTHEGEMTVITSKLGTAYAAWAGRRILFGTRGEVERALAATTPPTWMQPDDLPSPSTFATTAFAGASSDPAFGNLLGVPTTRWRMGFESPRKPWPARDLDTGDSADDLDRFGREQQRLAERKERERKGLPAEEPKPAPSFRGRIELTFGSPAQATQAAGNLAKASFVIPVEENLAAALSKLPQKVTDSTVTITFDQSSFPGVELEKLQAWVASLQQPR